MVSLDPLTIIALTCVFVLGLFVGLYIRKITYYCLRLRGKIAALIIASILLYLAFHGYQLYTASREIELTGVSIPLALALDLHWRNPTSSPIEIERLSYEVYANDRLVAYGSLKDYTLPPNSETPIRISVENMDFDSIRLSSRYRPGFLKLVKGIITIKGVVDIPLKFFGVLKAITLSIPYEYSITPSTPTKPDSVTTLLTLNPPPSNVTEGSTVTFTGKLIRADTNAGIAGVEILIVDSDPVGLDVIASGTTNSEGAFSIAWTAKPTDTTDRTVEAYAVFRGSSYWDPAWSPTTPPGYYVIWVESNQSGS